VALRRGETDRAILYYEESMGLYRDLGGKRGLAHVSKELGDIAFQQGDLPRAAELWESRLNLCRELGDRRRVAASLHTLGNITLRQGDFKRAMTLLEESRALYQSLVATQTGSDKLGVTSHLGEVIEPPPSLDQR
jgi:tetratricopeptide (TPR) repeat protein